MKKVVDIVSELARPVVEKHGCELWNVELVKEAGQWFLRVFVDKTGGVDITDCENISRELDPILDEADPIAESYVFEVSSAGAERALKRPSDFERFMGSNVAAHLYKPKDGKKEYVGKLLSYKDGDIEVETKAGVVALKKNEVSLVRLRVEF